MPEQPARLGRIGYVNVLPVSWGLECGAVPHDFALVSGTPAELNGLMAQGRLDLSAVSAVEYARRPERYLLVPDLAIGSRGPVRSVLLVSRVPVAALAGRRVALSAASHTSAALLRLLFARRLGLAVRFEIGEARAFGRPGGDDGIAAALAIGDEALLLARDPAWPHRLDLGEMWREWTGLPFVFGLWAARRDFVAAGPARAAACCATLLAAKVWGCSRPDLMAGLAAQRLGLPAEALAAYFRGLVFDLGPEERAGLARFFAELAACGEIAAAPALRFCPLP